MTRLFTGMARVTLSALLLAAASCSPSPSAQESQVSAPATTVEPRDDSEAQREAVKAVCKSYGQLASQIMTARQGGVSMATSMEAGPDMSAETRRRIESMVIAAYDQPRMSVDANQKRMVQDFENDVYLECIKNR